MEQKTYEAPRMDVVLINNDDVRMQMSGGGNGGGDGEGGTFPTGLGVNVDA